MAIRRCFLDKRAFNFFLFFMAIAVLTGLLVIVINPDLKSLLAGVPTASTEGKRPTGLMLVLEYVFNNGFKVPLGMAVLSLVPIGYLYLFQPSVTTGLLGGLLMGVALNVHSQVAVSLAVSALPHTVTEMYAYAAWASSLFTLNKWIRDKMRRKENQQPIIDVLRGLALKYLSVVLPLIIAGAFLETYIADWIMKLIS